MIIPANEARDLIERTFNEFIRLLEQSLDLLRDRHIPYPLISLPGYLHDWKSCEGEDVRNYLFKDLNAESYNYLLQQCFKLANGYQLSTRDRLAGATVENEPQESKTVKKLIGTVHSFGDEELSKRLAEIESGQSLIVFERMDGNTEGQTVYENGSVTYRLNKKYEKITSDEDLWRASIILAHELQRNPETGDLRGETVEIVSRDMAFVERVISVHGEKVYEQMPEFALLRCIKEELGETALKQFIDIAFQHERSYFELRPFFYLFDSLSLFNIRDPSIQLMNFFRPVSRGDEAAKTYLGFFWHQVGRDLLKEISKRSSQATLVFLAIGMPQVAGGIGSIGTAAEVILALDDFVQGNYEEGFIRARTLVASMIVGSFVKALANMEIQKVIRISVGRNSLYYPVGMGCTLNTKEVFLQKLDSDIASTLGLLAAELTAHDMSKVKSNAIEAWDALEAWEFINEKQKKRR